MANEIWDLTRKTMVFYDRGKGDTRSGGSTKLVQAPFYLVNLGNDGGTAISPVDSFRVSVNSGKDYFLGTDSPSGLQAQICPDEEFYFDGDILVIGEHEMGDYKGNPESWKGLHKFSNI